MPLDDMVLLEITEEVANSEERKKKQELESRGFVYATTPDANKQKLREETGSIFGKIISMGENAFKYLKDGKPKVGDIVVYNRYNGMELDHTQDATVWFRLMEDRDIVAIHKGE